jgi:hypothetical protein
MSEPAALEADLSSGVPDPSEQIRRISNEQSASIDFILQAG